MDWIDEEVHRRLNDGTHNQTSASGVMDEARRIRKDIEREERSRMLKEENNRVLKNQLIEAQNANRILEEQNKALKEANKKLETQINDFEKESISNKRRSNISIAIALASLVVAVVAIVLSITLK